MTGKAYRDLWAYVETVLVPIWLQRVTRVASRVISHCLMFHHLRAGTHTVLGSGQMLPPPLKVKVALRKAHRNWLAPFPAGNPNTAELWVSDHGSPNSRKSPLHHSIKAPP